MAFFKLSSSGRSVVQGVLNEPSCEKLVEWFVSEGMGFQSMIPDGATQLSPDSVLLASCRSTVYRYVVQRSDINLSR